MKAFCKWQTIRVFRGKNKLLCCAHLIEAHVFECPYKSIEQAQRRDANGSCESCATPLGELEGDGEAIDGVE